MKVKKAQLSSDAGKPGAESILPVADINFFRRGIYENKHLPEKS